MLSLKLDLTPSSPLLSPPSGGYKMEEKRKVKIYFGKQLTKAMNLQNMHLEPALENRGQSSPTPSSLPGGGKFFYYKLLVYIRY